DEGQTPHGLVYYESVRGCPFLCTYCLSSVDKKIRAKSVERTLLDVLGFEEFSDIKTVKFVDRTFNFDAERAKKIWRGLCRPEYTKEYHFEICASLLDEESINILKNAPKGKFRVEIGLQSTNPKTLAAIKRSLDVKKTLENAKALFDAGNIFVHLDLIAGLPYEDYRSFARSFDDAYGLCNELQLGFLKILCGCEMERDAERYGIVYSETPPYEVLKTDFISFEELSYLSRIDELCERFSNSGNFRYTFPYLPKKYGSPFEFFEKLASFYEEKSGTSDISKLSQINAFLLILDFSESIFSICDMREIQERLALDFLMSEARRLPPPLGRGILADEKTKNELLIGVSGANRSLCEAAKLGFISENYIIVDREKKKIFKTEVPYGI
ncbi:MAG: DUF4080 domain-containing protein, partial [Eubacteriales bacterium]